MAQSHPTQNFENHAKIVVGYHYVTTVFVLIFTIWAALNLFREPGFDTVAMMSLAIAVNLVGYYVRAFANGNQDRIIRLEERLRMREVLPADLQGRIEDLTISQLVALRFASDGELPELTRRVLDGGLEDRKAIKKMVEHWRADHQRI